MKILSFSQILNKLLESLKKEKKNETTVSLFVSLLNVIVCFYPFPAGVAIVCHLSVTLFTS